MDDYSRSQNNTSPKQPTEAEIARLVGAAEQLAHGVLMADKGEDIAGFVYKEAEAVADVLALPCFSQYKKGK